MPSVTAIFRKSRRRKKRPSAAETKQAEAEYRQDRERALFGSLGPASPTKRIDPRTGKIVALIEPATSKK